MATGALRRNGGGLLDKFTSIFSLMGYLDEAAAILPLVRQWMAIEADWSTVQGIRERAAVIVVAGKIITEATPNETDDAIVAQFRALIDNESLVETVAWLIGRFRAENPSGDAAQFQAFVQRSDVQESLAERENISMGEIMQVIKLITELVTLLKGMFGGTATAGTGTTGATSGGGLFDF